MEQKHRDLIRSNYRALGREYSTAIADVCDCLFENRILNDAMRQDILANKTKLNQGYRLLDLITKRGPKAFDALYQASLDESLYTACDILRPDNSPHEPNDELSSSSKSEGLEADSADLPAEGNVWPSNEYLKNLQDGALNVLSVENKDKKFAEHINDDKVYPMTRSPRGYPLIVFDEKIPSSLDRSMLQMLFEGLGFGTLRQVQVKTEQDVKEKLAEEPSFTKECDCFVLIVLSTGYLNGEGLELLKKKVKENFILSMKPKLIFHLPVENDAVPKNHEGSPPNSVVKTKVEPDENKDQPMYESGKIESVQVRRTISQEHREDEREAGDQHDGPIREERTHKESDLCVIEATEYGRTYFDAGEKRGSRFFHLIVDIFSKKAHSEKLIDLLRQVNRRTGEDVLTYKKTLRRELYFFPGCSK